MSADLHVAHGRREQEALPEPATELLERGELFVAFDPFGDRAEAELVSESHDRPGQTGLVGLTVAAESVLPALCGLAVGDRARPGAGAGAIAGYVLAVASAVVIAVISRGSSDAADPTATELSPSAVPSALSI